MRDVKWRAAVVIAAALTMAAPADAGDAATKSWTKRWTGKRIDRAIDGIAPAVESGDGLPWAVIDADGNPVGIVVGIGDEIVTIDLRQDGEAALLRFADGVLIGSAPSDSLWYTSSDCTGDPYIFVTVDWMPSSAIHDPDGQADVWIGDASTTEKRAFFSERKSATREPGRRGLCQDGGGIKLPSQEAFLVLEDLYGAHPPPFELVPE